MKKRLLASVLVSSALMLGACSNEAQGTDDVDNTQSEEVKQEEKQNENVISYEAHGEEKTVEVVGSNPGNGSAEKLYLPNKFSITENESGDLIAKGSGEFEHLTLFAVKEETDSSVEMEIYVEKRKATKQMSEQEPVVKEIDFAEHPTLGEKYDFGQKIDDGNLVRYRFFKVIDGYKHIFSLNVAKEANDDYEEFAIEVLRRIEF